MGQPGGQLGEEGLVVALPAGRIHVLPSYLRGGIALGEHIVGVAVAGHAGRRILLAELLGDLMYAIGIVLALVIVAADALRGRQFLRVGQRGDGRVAGDAGEGTPLGLKI